MIKRWLFLVALLVPVAAGAVVLRSYFEAPTLPTTSAGADARGDGQAIVCFGRVDLEAGVTALGALHPGRVVAVCIDENSEVQAGTILVRMDDALAKLRVGEAEVALKLAQEQLGSARTQVERQEKLLAQQQGALRAAEHRSEAARSMLASKQRLWKAQLINAEEVAAAREEAEAMKALAGAEAARLAETRINDPTRQVRRAELGVAAAQNRLRQAAEALEECSLKAPEAGTVLRILVSPGEVIATPDKPVAMRQVYGLRLFYPVSQVVI